MNMKCRAVAGLYSMLLLPALAWGQSPATYLPDGTVIYPNGVGFINSEGIAEYQSFHPRPKPRRPRARSWRIVDERGHLTVLYEHGFGYFDENGTAVYEPYAPGRLVRPGGLMGGRQPFALVQGVADLEIRKSGGNSAPPKPSTPKPAPSPQNPTISAPSSLSWQDYVHIIRAGVELFEQPDPVTPDYTGLRAIAETVGNDPANLTGEYNVQFTQFPGLGTPQTASLLVRLEAPQTIFMFVSDGKNYLQGIMAGGVIPGSSPNVTYQGDLKDSGGKTVTHVLILLGSNGIDLVIMPANGTPGTAHLQPTLTEASHASTNSGDTVDPISTASGELLAGPFVDLDLGGPLPLVFRRTYGALGALTGTSPLGYNWMSNFDPYVTINGNLAVVVLEGGGSASFQLNGNTYATVFPARMAYQLVKNANGYRYFDPESELIHTFDTMGRLIRIEDRNGNALTLTRSGSLGLPSQISDGLGRSFTFTYSSAGRLTKVQDQSGRSVSYSQDAQTDLVSVTDADGNTTNFSYFGNQLTKTTRPRGNVPYTQTFNPLTGSTVAQTDSFGNTTAISYVAGGKPGNTVVTDPLGRSTTFNYPSLVDLSSFTDAAGQSASYTYDALHRPLSFTDRLGNPTLVTYDAASGYVASIKDAQGNTTTFTYQSQVQGDFTFYNLAQITYADRTTEIFTYDGSGNVLKATNRAGKTSTFTYNSRGQVLTETNEAGGVTTYTYNSDATLATSKLPSGDVTMYSYDNLMRLAKIQHADNTSVGFTRDAVDQVLSTTDERGKVTKLAYDLNNNFQSLTDPLSQTSKLTYDTDDLPIATTDPLGNTTKLQYDPLGSATAITNAAGEKTTLAYDNLERLKSVADPAGKGPSYTYDAEGRLASVTDAVGNKWSIQVNKNGQPTKLTSPLSETTALSYDGLNRVTGITDALSRNTSVSYEHRGLPTSLAAPGGLTTSLEWGDLPLLKSVTDPNGNRWSITRDTLGRVTSAADPLGQTLAYKYDARSRVSSVASLTDSVQITYDPAGNVSQAKYSDGDTLSYTYDDDNRLTGGTGLALSYDAAGRVIASNGLKIARDAVGRISSITHAPGKTVTYKYDKRGLISSATDWAGGSIAFTFDDAHRLVSLTRSNGVVTEYTYDADGRVTSITEAGADSMLSSIGLTRDAIGRVTSASRNVPQDAALSGAALSFSYDAANQISGDTYDSRGRLTNDISGAKYEWSASSRLLSYSRPDGSASFTYDALGQRISRTSSGSTVNYVLNYATVLPTVATVQSGGSDITYYVYTPGGALLYSVDAASGTHRFYAFDDTGATLFLTDDKGAITDTYGVSPYGELITAGASNKTNNPFIWQGQLGVMHEPATSLYYARFRYYDSASSRFLSRDPVFSPAPRQVNPYQYAAGNPVANGDPSGLKTQVSAPQASHVEAPDVVGLLCILLLTWGGGGESGMSTIDPPTLQNDDFQPVPPLHSVVNDLSSIP